MTDTDRIGALESELGIERMKSTRLAAELARVENERNAYRSKSTDDTNTLSAEREKSAALERKLQEAHASLQPFKDDAGAYPYMRAEVKRLQEALAIEQRKATDAIAREEGLEKERDDYKRLMFESDERAERRLKQVAKAEADLQRAVLAERDEVLPWLLTLSGQAQDCEAHRCNHRSGGCQKAFSFLAGQALDKFRARGATQDSAGDGNKPRSPEPQTRPHQRGKQPQGPSKTPWQREMRARWRVDQWFEQHPEEAVAMIEKWSAAYADLIAERAKDACGRASLDLAVTSSSCYRMLTVGGACLPDGRSTDALRQQDPP